MATSRSRSSTSERKHPERFVCENMEIAGDQVIIMMGLSPHNPRGRGRVKVTGMGGHSQV